MSKTPELLPCPFCGNKAKLTRPIERVPLIIVSCTTCGAKIVYDLVNEEDMTKTWNTRVYPAEITEKLPGKKPIKGHQYLTEGDEFICPNCEGHIRTYGLKMKCCYHCGQRLDWSAE